MPVRDLPTVSAHLVFALSPPKFWNPSTASELPPTPPSTNAPSVLSGSLLSKFASTPSPGRHFLVIRSCALVLDFAYLPFGSKAELLTSLQAPLTVIALSAAL